jgi:2',3'-cyclic-nucleotide 2'-phosphodiesterase (5'-nucleotidase family)
MKIYEYEIVSNYIPFPINKNYSANAPIGNLITNVVANSIKRQNNLDFDFLILNSGGFRTTWYPGVIRYAELHSMFPFGNDELYSFKISGKDMKRML